MSGANNRLGLLEYRFGNLNKIGLALISESSAFREICDAIYTYVLEPLLQDRLPDNILLTSVDLKQKDMTTTMLEMMSVKRMDSEESEHAEGSEEESGGISTPTRPRDGHAGYVAPYVQSTEDGGNENDSKT